ncbi:hypothetical protein [Streptomyces longispororuber]|uniref:hypothetical protein n=1 Tax=Streptomyces longispororuber TaxID=68230 RepID=UPI00210AFB6B|nr:hypothetical protein [Streptomyces longispororuber]MCQ4205625.1 hypothetical protein [Streptomyces longispororuber]
MNHSKILTRACAAVLTGAFALTGLAAGGSAHASGWDPDDWGPGGSWSETLTWSGSWTESAAETWTWSGNGHDDHAAPAVVTARTEVYVRDAPTVHARATATLPAGSHVRLFCQTDGGHADGTVWYFDNDAHGWISAAHVRPTGWQPPSC